MTSIEIKKDLSEEFLSDILVTAFDGGYGGAWMYGGLEPASENWLTVKHLETCNWRPKDPTDSKGVNVTGCACGSERLWMSAHVRTNIEEGYEIGDKVMDRRDGFEIDHEAIARGMSIIINDDYVNANPGETARGLRDNIASAVRDEEAGDIDAIDAAAIVQCAAFGKVIFG